ncbi:MAG: ACT domain-containing protein, partial [Flavobacteriaceae bacterium]
GDPVFGFVSVKEGIKIHKNDCPNALSLQSNYSYRIIKAKWVDSSSDEFTATLKLSGIDNMGIVSEVTQSISNIMNVNINKLSFDSEDGVFSGLISVSVKNKTILNKLVNNLLKVKGVDKVQRE